MKKILNTFFVTLGIIFFVLIIIGAYFFVTDPYNLKPLIFGTGPTISTPTAPTKGTDAVTTPKNDDATTETSPASNAGGFSLSGPQKQALVGLGIDPAAVPSTISPEQETCFVTALGAPRVAEIKAGAVPNALEFAKAKSCI